MRAIAVNLVRHSVSLVGREEPSIQSPDEVKIQVLQVGICKTDHEIIQGHYGRAPVESGDLVIGHEMLGKVVEVGSAVSNVSVGDYVTCTVRRSCEACRACLNQRADICESGKYLSCGITGLDGFLQDFLIEKAPYVIPVHSKLLSVGVLAEPFSVIEKALGDALGIMQVRFPPSKENFFAGQRCLIVGLGSIGLLAAMKLRLLGATVYGLDLCPDESFRPQWFQHIGGYYLNTHRYPPEHLTRTTGKMDLIIEAAGVFSLQLQLFDVLARNGIFIVLGLPAEQSHGSPVHPATFRRLTLQNQMVMGSVNASQMHFRMALHDLELALDKWGGHVEALITKRYSIEQYHDAFQAKGDKQSIKNVVML